MRSNPRIYKVSSELIGMVNALPGKGDKIFGKANPSSIRATFCNSRKRTAEKRQNPRLPKIHFHTLRHWKATMLYHKTNDLLYVTNFLGHKSIKNTLMYVQIEEAMFKESSDEFLCRITKTVEEAKDLTESGFEYVQEWDGLRLYRIRK